jgi:hypothetical protein
MSNGPFAALDLPILIMPHVTHPASRVVLPPLDQPRPPSKLNQLVPSLLRVCPSSTTLHFIFLYYYTSNLDHTPACGGVVVVQSSSSSSGLCNNMLLSLPPSLISLLLCLLDARVLADSAPSPTPTALHIADYVASGFGINDTLKNPQITSGLQSTGTGLEYASKCQDALSTWSKSSFWYGWDDAIVGTSTVSSGFTETHRLAGSTKVTSVITLCDGHPRVVGRTSVSTGNLTTSTAAWTNTYTESKFNSAYPTPAPCSIQPDDCKALSSDYNSKVTSLISRYGQATIQPPVCTITPSSSYSYSTDEANGKTCDNCQIAASTARGK